ncbi:MAG: hypothetical protein AAF552_02365 [Pseudomonadota bacterium]
MTRSELIGQLRQFIMLETDQNQLAWWQSELAALALVAEQRAKDSNTEQHGESVRGAPPPFVGTG